MDNNQKAAFGVLGVVFAGFAIMKSRAGRTIGSFSSDDAMSKSSLGIIPTISVDEFLSGSYKNLTNEQLESRRRAVYEQMKEGSQLETSTVGRFKDPTISYFYDQVLSCRDDRDVINSILGDLQRIISNGTSEEQRTEASELYNLISDSLF
mgnify:CR=1 FL=1